MYKPLICLLLGLFLLPNSVASEDKQHDKWLKEKFAEQHQALIPKVLVADIFYACNQDKGVDPIPYKLADIITKMPADRLADKVTECLGNDDIKSEQAIDYGLIACFKEQLSELPAKEREQKFAMVKKAIAALSLEEKQRSLTHCVTDQAIAYLQ
ncbi:hypothetical protein [Thalassotalea agarivorans]|uniref:Uncharacterized protein n=1 Tax=Thalassotalea agarivorans TaxID=349064 RepID=A0A1I0E407_THASX|nr:hypothetical protein [Thalassotalea agarivorans]SET39371.1 hypothetical protein SAMN05660429_01708 [Thalassotalea agarivorans]